MAATHEPWLRTVTDKVPEKVLEEEPGEPREELPKSLPIDLSGVLPRGSRAYREFLLDVAWWSKHHPFRNCYGDVMKPTGESLERDWIYIAEEYTDFLRNLWWERAPANTLLPEDFFMDPTRLLKNRKKYCEASNDSYQLLLQYEDEEFNICKIDNQQLTWQDWHLFFKVVLGTMHPEYTSFIGAFPRESKQRIEKFIITCNSLPIDNPKRRWAMHTELMFIFLVNKTTLPRYRVYGPQPPIMDYKRFSSGLYTWIPQMAKALAKCYLDAEIITEGLKPVPVKVPRLKWWEENWYTRIPGCALKYQPATTAALVFTMFIGLLCLIFVG